MPPAFGIGGRSSLPYTALADSFRSGRDSPRAYLERHLEVIAAREPVVRAWAFLNVDGARAQADASTGRWRAGRALSPIDGIPLGIKDMLETIDMPTEMGVPALKGHFPKRDNAGVAALRQAGAVILGKTVTTEYGGILPSVTTNPFDPLHSPGGSSSGTAAAVGAGMVPAAIGSQVVGSMIRPASYCANYALKPSQGAINRGEAQSKTMLTHGPHAATLEDMWAVAIEMAARAGGDPGCIAMTGPRELPGPRRPLRIAIMETEGFGRMDEASLAAFDAVLAQVAAKDVAILRRADDPRLEEFEQALAGISRLNLDITAWENQWALRSIRESSSDPEGISPIAAASIATAEELGVEGYERALRRRTAIIASFGAVETRFDAFISPASLGPAPRLDALAALQAGQGFATGDPVFNAPPSLLGACAIALPLAAVGGLPMGIQLMGPRGAEARTTAIANWLRGAVAPVRA